MKIDRAYTILTCPGRNFVTLKIVTDDGVHGLGDATLNGRELAVKAYLDEHVIPCLIGRDPHNIEDIWQYLYRGAYWRRGAVTMAAIAAVDVALWDIKGKLAGMPVYQLLGGRSRSGAMVYGHANGRDHAETVEAVGRYLEKGFKAIRVQSGVDLLEGQAEELDANGHLLLRSADGTLHQSPQRAGTVRRVIAGEGQPLPRGRRDIEPDPDSRAGPGVHRPGDRRCAPILRCRAGRTVRPRRVDSGTPA